MARRVEEIHDGGSRVVVEESVPPTESAHASEVVGEETVTHGDGWYATQGVVRTIQGVIAVITLGLESLLAFRFAFLLAGANPGNGFVDFIYDSTNWLVDPFEGIANPSTVGDDGVFDPATLITMAVVMVVAALIVLALSALTSYSGTGAHSTTRTTSRHGHSSHEG
jgi:hypothetical protein